MTRSFPILLHLLGANRVVTIDLNPWLTSASLSETLKGFESIIDLIATDFSPAGRDAERQAEYPTGGDRLQIPE